MSSAALSACLQTFHELDEDMESIYDLSSRRLDAYSRYDLPSRKLDEVMEFSYDFSSRRLDGIVASHGFRH